MKFFAALAFLSVAAAAAVESDSTAPIVRSSYEIAPEGSSFQYAYETGNGISAQADGVVNNPNSDNPELEVRGSYRYTAPDGTPIELSYVANEGGYVPQGSHLPVPPPIPEAIQRSLDWIAAHPPPPEGSARPQQPARLG